MTTIPREAREGLMRAWVTLLREKHPEVTWIPAQIAPGCSETKPTPKGVTQPATA